MPSLKAIVNEKILLEKYEGKGGWTYARVPKTLANSRKAFGWKKLKGTIDNYEVECTLMPMNKEQWFLPVKAEIRKAINKQAGDYVQVVLYAEVQEMHTPEEFLLCLEDDPEALKNYHDLPDKEKKLYLDWIFEVNDEETQVQRMADAIDKLSRGEKMANKFKSQWKAL